MQHNNHTGISPVYTEGKYAEKTCTKYGNYGTDTFKRAKKSARREGKKDLKNINLKDL